MDFTHHRVFNDIRFVGFEQDLNVLMSGGFKHEVQHGITIDETPLQAF